MTWAGSILSQHLSSDFQPQHTASRVNNCSQFSQQYISPYLTAVDKHHHPQYGGTQPHAGQDHTLPHLTAVDKHHHPQYGGTEPHAGQDHTSPHLTAVDKHDHPQYGGTQPHAGQVEEDGRAEADAAPDGRQVLPPAHLPALACLQPQRLGHVTEPVVRRTQ